MPDLPANNSTPVTMSVNDTYSSTIDVSGDRDWVRVNMSNNQTLQVNLSGDTSSGSGLGDSYVRIYDNTGTLVAFNDDASFGVYDSAVTFTAEYSGAYFIEAAGYGASTGDYEIETQIATPVNSLLWGASLDTSDPVNVYFVPSGGSRFMDAGEAYTSEGFNAYERAQIMSVFEKIENVTDLRFNVVTNAADADMQLMLDTNEIGSDGFLGAFNPPDLTYAGNAVFNGVGAGWDRTAGGGLEEGGYGYATIMHELLHGVGLAHPHDSGGSSIIMEGVTSPFGSFGNSDLNQGVYTSLTYNSGYADGSFATQGDVFGDYGYEAGPMALDIAALQSIYGDGNGYRTGNTVYNLPDRFDDSIYWESIWDTGGTDEIRYSGYRDTTIDLREATLQYETGGGGFLSMADDTAGGFTIAHGVVIENATGDEGDDRLVGNTARNVLIGNDGNDTAYGRDGNDILQGGNGRDYMSGGRDDDQIWGGNDGDRVAGGGGRDIVRGGNGNDVVIGGTDVDALFGGNNNDSMYGGSYLDRMQGDDGNDRLFGGTGGDTLRGENGEDRLFGGRDNDALFGGNGSDFIEGGAGQDRAQGNGGQDTFSFRSMDDVDRGASRRDIIGDFTNDVDTLDLSRIDADSTRSGDQAFDLIGRAGFSDAGQLRVQWSDTRIVLQADTDGDGVADFEIELRGLTSIQDNDILL